MNSSSLSALPQPPVRAARCADASGKRIVELDGLRGVAILAVLNDHYMSWFPALGSHLGWLGVDLFFVLSGFLITSILLELRPRENYFGVFYARRALRIFPPYYLAIAVYLGFSFASGHVGSSGLWLQYTFYYTSLFIGFPPQLHAVPPILPGPVALGLSVLWSLSVEEIYYTIWAPVVRFTNQRQFLCVLGALFLAAPCLRWILHTPAYPELFTFYCRMDGLAYGSLVAFLVRERRLCPGKWLHSDRWFDLLAMGVAVISLSYWLMEGADRSRRSIAVPGLVMADITFALFAYALIRRAGNSEAWVKVFRTPWLCSIGTVSYSLYLFHYPLRSVAIALVARLHEPTRVTALLEVAVGLTLSFAAAYGLWFLMESRILKWKDRRIPTSSLPSKRSR